MKLLMIVYSGPSPARIVHLFETHDVSGWTELDHARGAGASGRREATRAWPGESALFFTVVETGQADALRGALVEERDRLEPGERLHTVTLPVEDFF